jgi:predicted DNA-binding transcriptional regulator YafY
VRADRLLSILLLLQTHGRLTAGALAARLEVSERTIDRDMEALSIAGVPVWAQRGRRGGWQLSDSYRTDLTGLTEPELRGLVLATTPGVIGDLGLGEAIERALVKILAELPEGRRRDAEAARGYLHVDPSGWRRTDDAAPRLAVLEDALRRRCRISMQYLRGSDEAVVERVVDPLGLVAKGSVWYLVAAVNGEPRTYRASRIRDVLVLDEPADRPVGFELAAFWGRSRSEYEKMLPTFLATIRVSPVGRSRLGFGWWRYASLVSEDPPDADGWTRCHIRADTIAVAHDCVLGLGAEAEVVEPPELRERVLASARELVRAAERA